jgi:hypothetical protein
VRANEIKVTLTSYLLMLIPFQLECIYINIICINVLYGRGREGKVH